MTNIFTLDDISETILTKKVSVFSTLVAKTDEEKIPLSNITIREWLDEVSNDDKKPIFDKIHAIALKKDRDKYKLKCPAISGSATFKTRDKEVPLEDRIVEYSGIIIGDFDGIIPDEVPLTPELVQKVEDTKKAVASISYIYCAVTSFSNRGFYVIILTDNTDYKRHKEYFDAIYLDMLKRGYTMDASTADVTRLRCASYDGNIAYNLNPQLFTLPPTEEAEETDIKPGDIPASVKYCVKEFCKKVKDDAEHKDKYIIGKGWGNGEYYDRYYRIGISLASMGESGFKPFDTLVKAFPEKYDEQQNRQYFDGFLKAQKVVTNKATIGIGTFFYMMKEWGIVPPREEAIHLSLEGLPPFAREIVEGYANAFQCPKEFILAALMTATGTLVGKRVCSNDGLYYNYPQLWTVLVAPSGSGKTAPANAIFKPLREIDSRMREEYTEALRKYNIAVKNNGDEPKPRQDVLLIGDITPEKRTSLLAQSSYGLCEKVDEFGSWIQNFNRYHAGGEVSDILSIYNNESYPCDRNDGTQIVVKDPFMSVFGTTQPDQLPVMFNNKNYQGNGFIPRVMWIWNGDETIPDYKITELPDDVVKTWREAVNFFHNWDEETLVRWSGEAREIYTDFVNSHNDKLRKGVSSIEAEILQKTNVNCERVALVVWLLWKYQDEIGSDASPIGDEIDGNIMKYAVECMEYFDKSGFKVQRKVFGTPTDTRKILIRDALKVMMKKYPHHSQAEWANFLGVTDQAIHDALKAR